MSRHPPMLTCAECGARIEERAVRCLLCGWPVAKGALEREKGVPQADRLPPRPVFCNACGWKNPRGARYCSQCGDGLQTMVPAPAYRKAVLPPIQEEGGEPGKAKIPAPARQVGVVVAASVALVVTLFLVTAVSKRTHPTVAEEVLPAMEVAAVPLSGALAEQVAVLDGQMQQDTGFVRITRQREKAYLLMQSDRLDLAAVEYQALAEVTGAVEDWRIAGDLFYDWMTGEQDARRRTQIASNAVAAYEEVLEMAPDNLGVRTDLATAYLHTGTPMKGVVEIKRVLEADSTHLDANFNYGLMLWRIGRNDQAAAQFRKVMKLAGNPSEHYSRAREALHTLQPEAPF